MSHTINGVEFATELHAQTYMQLLHLKRQHIIKDFRIAPHYLLQEEFEKVGHKYSAIEFVADFEATYLDGHAEVIDCIGRTDEAYSIKRKMFEYWYPDLRLRILSFDDNKGWLNDTEWNTLRKARNSLGQT